MKFITLIFLVLTGVIHAQESEIDAYIDSLKNVIASTASDYEKIKAYQYWDLEIYLEDPLLDEELNIKMIEICDRNLSNKHLPFDHLSSFFEIKCNSLNNLGLVASDFGDYLKAQHYFQECLNYSLLANDSTQISYAYNNLGMISGKLFRNEKAIEYYKLGMIYEGSSSNSKAIYYNNIGVCYVNLGQDSLATDCYRKSITLSTGIYDQANKSNALGNLAELFLENEQPDSALAYFEMALAIDKEINNVFNILFHKVKLGLTHIALDQPLIGMQKCHESLDLLKENPSLVTESECHKCLYLASKKLNKDHEALLHYEQFALLQDSLIGVTKSNEFVAFQLQAEYQRKNLSDSITMVKNQAIKELGLNKSLEQKQTQQNYLFFGLGVVGLFGIFFYRNYKLKQRDNRLITVQKNDLEKQKNLVDLKNKEIVDSINYARRLQSAILPSDSSFRLLLPNSFVFYSPKDIVAGDFYWIEEFEQSIYFACADCTGHGVPGAMLSVVCHNALNRALKEFKCLSPAEILTQTRALVIETFDSSEENVKDGMDIALCAYNRTTNKLEFAGAYNSLYLIRDKQVQKITGDKQPVGTYFKPTLFTNHTIQLTKNDQIFMFTDGIVDQFGGELGKKMKYAPFIQFLKTIHQSPIENQKKLIGEFFEKWKGNFDQLDDICIMGIKFDE